MRGRVVVTLNQLPVASFTASATDVNSGASVRFDAAGSDDSDFANGQSLNYSWDLDGHGADDPGQISPTPSMVYGIGGKATSNRTPLARPAEQVALDRVSRLRSRGA